jgi:dTDP-glucose 4,6-dehydratase
MRSLLITGGAGFIGSNFCHHWTSRHPADRVTVLDAMTYAADTRNLHPLLDTSKLGFVRGDILDRDLVRGILVGRRVDTIVHFAAETHVDRSIADPARFVSSNVAGTCALLDAARDVWGTGTHAEQHRFHHISTDEVYGPAAPGAAANKEGSAYNPSSPYAASKSASDHFVRAYGRTYDLPVSISYCSNNYGPRQHCEKLIPQCMRRILSGEPIPVYGDGLQRRTWLYVDDHCAAIERILLASPTGESWNISGPVEQTNLETVNMVCAALDQQVANDAGLQARFTRWPGLRGMASSSLITHVEDRAAHDLRYFIDDSRMRSELQFKPETTFPEGLAKTLCWFLRHGIDWR